MSNEEFAALQPGDLVRDQSGEAWIVMQRDYNGTVIVAQTATIISPAQWTLTKTEDAGRQPEARDGRSSRLS